jgi:hypothetical protein
MGWKTLKEHYKIEHIVANRHDETLCIGSAYVHDLIRINKIERSITWGNLGPSQNDDLARYWDEFHADLVTFWKVVDCKDQFERSLPVYTYQNGEILELQCEKHGWPNVTHCGELMYDNTFFEDKNDAIARGKKDAALGVKFAAERVARCEQELVEARRELDDCRKVKILTDRFVVEAE